LRTLYRGLLKPILFRFDPERVHNIFVSLGEWFGRGPLRRSVISTFYKYDGDDLTKAVDGIEYKRPLILAAGFDYNARLVEILDCVSFGGVEVGSVTARPCMGNPPPRLRRMVKSQSLIVFKGLKNEGVDKIITRLKVRQKPKDLVWGISIAKTNDKEASTLEGGIADYCYSLRRLIEENIGDYYTLNISCPNVFGGEDFTTPENLELLLSEVVKLRNSKPVYVKMPINMEWDEFNQLLKVIDTHKLQGVIIGNLNKNYSEATFPEEAPEEYRGGLSGKSCFDRSNTLISQTRKLYRDRFTIIGCGGVLSVSDAKVKLEAGADLIQLISGMIFEGPHLMKEICYSLKGESK